MKEIETLWKRQGLHLVCPWETYTIKVSDVVVGRMRLWDDWEANPDTITANPDEVVVASHKRHKPRKRPTPTTTDESLRQGMDDVIHGRVSDVHVLDQPDSLGETL